MTYFEVSAPEHALIKNQSLRNKVRLRELYVRVAVT